MTQEDLNTLYSLLNKMKSSPPFSDDVNLTRHVDPLLAELRTRRAITRIGCDMIEELVKIPKEVGQVLSKT
jgi:hypothetical protein